MKWKPKLCRKQAIWSIAKEPIGHYFYNQEPSQRLCSKREQPQPLQREEREEFTASCYYIQKPEHMVAMMEPSLRGYQKK